MTKSFSVTLITYITAFFVAFFACKYSIGLNQWLMIVIGHLSATVVVFVFSVIFALIIWLADTFLSEVFEIYFDLLK